MKARFLFTFFLLNCMFSQAQLNVSPSNNALTLAQLLAGPNVTVTNASIAGINGSSGSFIYNGSAFQTNGGVVLSTGAILGAVGPNNEDGATSGGGFGAGDPALTALAGIETFDAIELRFSFEVQSDKIQFDYIFASEEYNEYVNQGFNDVFAFFISGPGITGEENIALVPGTNTPVTIDNINNDSFWQFYNDNENGRITNHTQFDGYTTLLRAQKSGLTPCSTYTLRLVIADAGDNQLDSGVLLQQNSLIQGSVAALTNTVNADDTALEGCIKASFTFKLDQPQPNDINIPFEILGSATNGVDYARIDNYVIIPAGQLEATVIIDAFADGITEGQEEIQLVYSPSPCAPKQTAFLYIDDAQPISFTLDGVNLSCNKNFSGEIDANISGGFSPYDITITDQNGNTSAHSSTNLPITGLPAGIYNVEVDDLYGCGGDAEVVGALFDAGQTFLPDGNGQVFSSVLNIAGISTPTLTTPDQLQSVCLKMEHSSLGDIEMRLISPNGTIVTLKERFNATDGGHTDLGEPVAKNSTDGGNASNVTPGIGYNYCFTASPTYQTMVDEHLNYTHTYVDQEGKTLTDNYLPAGSYKPYESLNALVGSPINGNWTIEVEDHRPQSNGYIFNWSLSFKVDNTGSSIELKEPTEIQINGGVTNASCNGSDGAINITILGDNPNFTYAWSNTATTEDISGLPAGTYTVTVTDANLCTNQATYNIPNATGPSISANISNEKCIGSNDGAIDVTLIGNIANISWNHGPNTEDLSALPPGVYTINVTDDQGCISIEQFTVNSAQELKVTSIITNEACGNKEGEVDLTVTGGDGNYSFSWSNGRLTEDITDLQQGSYTVTVTDGNNCSIQKTFSIINLVGNCTPNCDLSINNETIINETCGNNNGSITLSIFTSNNPAITIWSNGQTGNAISNLKAGTYTATISDSKSCTITKSFVVVNNAGSLTITNPIITDDVCGNKSGGINITTSGGAGNYLYSWSNGAITEDLSGITLGTYTVTVTDGNNCMVSGTYNVNNLTGNMSLSFENTVNEICGKSNGSIDINVSPNGDYTYLWSNGATTQDLRNLSAGNYTCTITQTSSGCKLITKAYTITNDAGSLVVSLNDKDDEICGNSAGEIDIKATGSSGYTFNWSNGANTEDIVGLAAGSYSCTITDANGCQANTGNIIIVNSPGTLAVSVFKSNEECSNGQGAIDINISGGTPNYNIVWDSGENIEDLSNISAGNYTYTVSDQNGCSNSSTVSITNGSGTLFIDSFIITDEICGDGSGSVDVTTLGGDGNYTFGWDNGVNTEDITGLSSGDFKFTVTDGNGCQATQTATIKGEKPYLQSISTSEEICGNRSGSVTITIAGGEPNYTYAWSTGVSNATSITNLAAGNYSCLVTDQSGCSININQTVNSSNGSLAISLVTITNSCNGSKGSIDTEPSGGVGNYSYSWSNGSSNQDITNIPDGTYTLTLFSGISSSCSVQETYTIENLLNLNNYIVTNDNCASGVGAIDLTTSGQNAISYLWSNGETTEDLIDIQHGNYSVTISNSTTCSITQAFEVLGEGLNVNVTGIANPTSCAGCKDGSISISAIFDSSVNLNDVEFSWSNGQKTKDINNLSPGVYILSVGYKDGSCLSTFTFTVEDGKLITDFTTPKIYPNPTYGDLIIDFGGVDFSGYKYDVYDVIGKIVTFGDFKEVKNKIDFSQYSSGVYFLTIKRDKEYQRIRIVVQN